MPTSTLLRAVLRALVLYCAVLTLTFVLLHLAPGDTVTMLAPADASAADLARLRSQLGLNEPLAVQYVRWVTHSLSGDFGESAARGTTVAALIRDALPVSLALGLSSLLLSFLLGTAAGVLQSARAGRWPDRIGTVVSVVLVSSPAYWLALGAVACFTWLASRWSFPLWLRLPAFGLATPGSDLHGLPHLRDLLQHAVLPVGILALIGAGGVARYARSSALDLRGADWMRTARAKGVTRLRVHTVHLLANMRAILITLFALSLPGVVAGSVFVESVFGWPGMGRLMVMSIIARDYPVVLGCTAAFAAVVLLANLGAELLLPLADPRLRGQ